MRGGTSEVGEETEERPSGDWEVGGEAAASLSGSLRSSGNALGVCRI